MPIEPSDKPTHHAGTWRIFPAAAIIAMFRMKIGIFTTLGGASAAGVALHFAGVLA